MKKKLLAGLATGLFLVGLASGASATAISNAGFEVTDTSAFLYNFTNDIAGWTIADTAGTWDTTAFGSQISGGSQVAFIGEKKNNAPGAISQSLLAFYDANTVYTLTFDVGWRTNHDNASSFQVDLLAGGSSVATKVGTSASQGLWETHSLTFANGSGFLSDNIEIKFAKVGGDQVLIDNVSLSSSSSVNTPEPASMLLLGTGLIGLAGYGRRRKVKK